MLSSSAAGGGRLSAKGEFDGADVGRGRIHGQMDLAPLASALRSVLANLPFAIAEELNASAVDQQVERTVGTAIRDLDGQRLLTTEQGRKIGRAWGRERGCQYV